MFELKEILAFCVLNSGISHSLAIFNSISNSFSVESETKNNSVKKKKSFPDPSVYNKFEGVKKGQILHLI